MAETFQAPKLLDAVTTITTGEAVAYPSAKNWNFFTTITSGTTGGTVRIQASADGTNYITLNTHTLSGTLAAPIGTSAVTYQLNSVHWPFVRAVLGTRTDGTYTVTAVGGN